ncbi:MAG: YitT family protein [Eubacteriales bacterium]|nr:YitT family protein [Eubacteriales bacterium]MDD3882392.1 YitT family protein [Eubacteriales bacterium]MDD4512387.1 YitT family protein [Eubacteriales bacterium]
MKRLQDRMTSTPQRKMAWAGTQILLGVLIGGIAYPAFLTPNNIAPGGLTGLATILNYLFGLPVGVMSLVMNLPLFYFGWRSMGRGFAARSLAATFLFSFVIDLIPIKPLTDNLLLSAVYGGIILGVGLGLILRGGATTGGTDMLAKMIHERFPALTVGIILLVLDFVVVALAGVFIDMESALYAMVTIFISSKVIDLCMEGINTAKLCFIVSDKYAEVSETLMKQLDHGCTYLDSSGVYSGKKREMIMIMVYKLEVPQVKALVSEIDSKAFMIVVDTHEALGEGFKALSDK